MPHLNIFFEDTDENSPLTKLAHRFNITVTPTIQKPTSHKHGEIIDKSRETTQGLRDTLPDGVILALPLKTLRSVEFYKSAYPYQIFEVDNVDLDPEKLDELSTCIFSEYRREFLSGSKKEALETYEDKSSEKTATCHLICTPTYKTL